MASSLFLRSGYPYDNDRLLVDVANSTYAIRNQITARGVRALWNNLCSYVNTSLKQRKVCFGSGVAISSGPAAAVGESRAPLLSRTGVWRRLCQQVLHHAGRPPHTDSAAPSPTALCNPTTSLASRESSSPAWACLSWARRWKTATRRSNASAPASASSTGASAASPRSAAASAC
jgi:hypothetical protein